jgi:hypothetical protein
VCALKLKHIGRAVAQAAGHRLVAVQTRFQPRVPADEVSSAVSEHIPIHKLEVSFLNRHVDGRGVTVVCKKNYIRDVNNSIFFLNMRVLFCFVVFNSKKPCCRNERLCCSALFKLEGLTLVMIGDVRSGRSRLLHII